MEELKSASGMGELLLAVAAIFILAIGIFHLDELLFKPRHTTPRHPPPPQRRIYHVVGKMHSKQSKRG